jgi:hypothetical protein
MLPAHARLRYPSPPVTDTKTIRTKTSGRNIANPRSSNTATYMYIRMQTNDFAKHMFQYRYHDIQKQLSRARAHMTCVHLSRDACSHQRYILGEYSVEVLVYIEFLYVPRERKLRQNDDLIGTSQFKYASHPAPLTR